MKARVVVAIASALVTIAVNVLPRGPRVQSPDQNFMAQYGRCTELRSWGWPFTIYARYGGLGYVNPDEWLAWDVDPVFSRWNPIGFGADLALGMALVAGILWFPFRRLLPAGSIQEAGFPMVPPKMTCDSFIGAPPQSRSRRKPRP